MTDLTDINGVGPTIAENLRAAGYETVDAVRQASPDDLAEVALIGEATARLLSARCDGGTTRGPDPEVEDHIDEVIEHARKPISDRGVIRLSPISRKTYKRWKKKDGEPFDTFQERWEEARATAEERLVQDGLYGEADSSLVKFLLKATHGYEDKQTVEHEGETPLADVTIDFENVDT